MSVVTYVRFSKSRTPIWIRLDSGGAWMQRYLCRRTPRLALKPAPACRRFGNLYRFLKGPISWAWLSAAAQCRGKALHVSVAL